MGCHLDDWIASAYQGWSESRCPGVSTQGRSALSRPRVERGFPTSRLERSRQVGDEGSGARGSKRERCPSPPLRRPGRTRGDPHP